MSMAPDVSDGVGVTWTWLATIRAAGVLGPRLATKMPAAAWGAPSGAWVAASTVTLTRLSATVAPAARKIPTAGRTQAGPTVPVMVLCRAAPEGARRKIPEQLLATWLCRT